MANVKDAMYSQGLPLGEATDLILFEIAWSEFPRFESSSAAEKSPSPSRKTWKEFQNRISCARKATICNRMATIPLVRYMRHRQECMVAITNFLHMRIIWSGTGRQSHLSLRRPASSCILKFYLLTCRQINVTLRRKRKREPCVVFTWTLLSITDYLLLEKRKKERRAVSTTLFILPLL